MAHQTSPRPPTRFLDLPVEVRLTIYAFYFADSRIQVSVETQSMKRVAVRKAIWVKPHLLFACRTTHIEARKPYYEAAIWMVEWSAYDTFSYDINNALALSCIKYMEICNRWEGAPQLRIDRFPSLVALKLDSCLGIPVDDCCTCDMDGGELYKFLVDQYNFVLFRIEQIVDYKNLPDIKVFAEVQVMCFGDPARGHTHDCSKMTYYVDLKNQIVVRQWKPSC